jgi:hypothetical protein
LNKSNAEYGVGAGAITTLGLYTQLFGWHLLLIHIGLLLRLVYENKDNYFKYIAIFITLAILIHLITATFMIAITLFYLLITNKRLLLFKSTILGLILSLFWLLPFLLYVGEFTRYSPQTSSEFLKIFLYYPIYSTFISLIQVVKGNTVILDYTNLFIFVLICIAFINTKLHKNKPFMSLTFFILVFVLLTNGYFPLNNFPLGMHYYRYIGLEILISVILLSSIFISLISQLLNKNTLDTREIFYGSVLTVLLIVSFISTIIFPTTWHKIYKNDNDYSIQDKVFRTVKSIKPDSRVYAEYLKNYFFLKPRTSQHYLSSLFFKDEQSESIAGIFQEQNNSYHYIISSLYYLKADAYSTPIYKESSVSSIDRDTAIKQLREFGINFLVVGTDKFYDSIKKYSLIKPIEIDKFKIVQVDNSNHREALTINKKPIGYIDIKNNLKFNYIDYYFYLNKYLTTNYELIYLNKLSNIPTQIDTLIINYLPEDINLFIKNNNLKDKKILFIDFNNQLFIINHYNPYYPDNIQLETYKLIRKYLNETINLEKQLRSLYQNNENQKELINQKKVLVNWDNNDQQFSLSGLIPNKIYRINYGYFPYWHTEDGQLFRGSGDRMFFIPDKSEASFEFTKLKTPSTWIGWGLTVVGIVYIIFITYRKKIKTYF